MVGVSRACQKIFRLAGHRATPVPGARVGVTPALLVHSAVMVSNTALGSALLSHLFAPPDYSSTTRHYSPPSAPRNLILAARGCEPSIVVSTPEGSMVNQVAHYQSIQPMLRRDVLRCRFLCLRLVFVPIFTNLFIFASFW